LDPSGRAEAVLGKEDLSRSAVLSIMREHRSAFGVARVGATTALDHLGIPTATAVRSDFISPSVSVASGKGLTPEQAEIAALGESLERFAGEPRGRIPLAREPSTALGDSIDPATLVLASWSRWRPDVPIEWCAGHRLEDGAPTWVPANAVFFPYEPTADEQLFAAHTTGLASHVDRERAILHGLLECVERDRYSRVVARLAGGHADAGTAIRAAESLRSRIESRGAKVTLREITAELGVPTVVATIVLDGVAHLGCAARLDLESAAVAAMLEAAQSRVTDIQGAREDLTTLDADHVPNPWFTADDPPTIARTPAIAGLAELVALLTPITRPVFVDLSISGVPLSCVRVIAPGLEDWGSDPDRAGERVRGWL
jgi:ribosomal protein S12 methylthiotransferase accessory factor